MAHVVGLKDETWRTFATAADQLVYYDGDFVNVTHATPHNWTPYGEQVEDRAVVHRDLSKWDYRHQVLEQKHLSPLMLFLAVKWLEMRVHARPGRLRSILIWCQLHTSAIWLCELLSQAPVTAELACRLERMRRWMTRTGAGEEEPSGAGAGLACGIHHARTSSGDG